MKNLRCVKGCTQLDKIKREDETGLLAINKEAYG